MTLEQKLKNREEVLKWLKSFVGIPEEIQPKELCQKCGTGIVWGIATDGHVNFMRHPETGGYIRTCGECNLKMIQQVENAHNRDSALKLRARLQKELEEKDEKYNKKSKGSGF